MSAGGGYRATACRRGAGSALRGLSGTTLFSSAATSLAMAGFELLPPADGAGVGVAVASDEGDEVDVAERGRADERGAAMSTLSSHRRLDECRRRVEAFGESGRDVALRFHRDEVEERQREILELGDLAPGWTRQRAERRDRGAEKPLGLLRIASDGDLTEVGGRHV